MAKKVSRIFVLIFLCFWVSNAAAATDTLNQGGKLDYSSFLVSKNGKVILQFSDYNTAKWYLTVWHIKDRLRTPIWIANRNTPIENNSTILAIDETGKLMIRYGDNGVLELYSHPSSTNVTAILQDDGNFVLKEVNSSEILWQSFDNPAASLIPGMKLGINHKTGKKWPLTSWLTNAIPSSGAFSLEWDHVSRQLVLLQRGETFWTSGEFNNGKFPNLKGFSVADYNFSLLSENEKEYVSLLPNENRERISGFSLAPDGSILDEESGLGILNGAWCDGSAIYFGCKRWKKPRCRRAGDMFQEVQLSSHSTTVIYNGNASLVLSDCKKMCWNDCKCVGVQEYPFYNRNDTGCIFLHGIRYNKTESGNQRKTFCIIVRGADHKSIAKWVRISTWTAATLIVLLVLVILLFIRWRRLRLEEKFLFNLMSEAKEIEIDGKKGFNLKIYSVSSIKKATNNFSSFNKLGEGGFGPVYKGVLLDGQEIAIKRLSGSSRQGLLEFKNELIIIAKLQHTILVRLLGFCIQGEEKILVYEYIPNKSLDTYIFDQSKMKLLDWDKYFNIIEEIAQGILYLHKYSRFRIIHRDLKVSNILLDENMNPKMSDFGLSKIFTTTQSEANTNRIVGTRGYIPPEYARGGIFSVKYDVFSFGVLVLEIISGRRSTSIFNSDQPLNLIGYAWLLWKDGAALELTHPTLRNSCSEEQVLRCINVALLCVEHNPVDRPPMSDVIRMLTSETVKLSMPKQPAFSINDRSNDQENPRES